MISKSDDIAISVKNLSKSFKLPHNKQTSIKSSLINLISKGDRTYEIQNALENVSFDIKKGEFFGIVGRNGSGKSTLLKLLAGIYSPTKGTVQVNGSLTPFIELGVGFNPDLTGRENIYLNGALLGFSREDMSDMYDDIVQFAELERFMDQKLKNYSSGMQVRLAFSIAIRAKSDILLFDEVLAVGDADFQKKCVATFRDLKKEKRTIILVTHDMSQVERFCDRALVLSNGEMVAITSPSEAAMTYTKLNINEKKLDNEEEQNIEKDFGKRPGSGVVRVKKVRLNSDGKKKRLFITGESLVLEIELSKQPPEDIDVALGLAIHNSDGVALTGPNTDNLTIPHSTKTVQYTIPKIPLNTGDYSITVALYDKKNREEIDVLFQAIHFSVVSKQISGGAVNIDDKWTFK